MLLTEPRGWRGVRAALFAFGGALEGIVCRISISASASAKASSKDGGATMRVAAARFRLGVSMPASCACCALIRKRQKGHVSEKSENVAARLEKEIYSIQVGWIINQPCQEQPEDTHHATRGRGKTLDTAAATSLTGVGLQRRELLVHLVQTINGRATSCQKRDITVQGLGCVGEGVLDRGR